MSESRLAKIVVICIIAIFAFGISNGLALLTGDVLGLDIFNLTNDSNISSNISDFNMTNSDSNQHNNVVYNNHSNNDSTPTPQPEPDPQPEPEPDPEPTNETE
ncbi:hypothetical protein MBCUT_13920 [Methanobrevibacter cuticularis]|uniref:Uncharacterized protein n=1 Tax=Methanobrevibacter cuticularis TaxID=47311 RepID=A0A166DHY7_9EURY|nr:hypothetical protein [Methanobrevibacter cuticularis]KZX15619.1 hypothetical protein MBCUT_13920 [Methanobrevibacter cuticularis]